MSNYKGANRLYRNNANGTFTDEAEALRVTQPITSFPAWFWDVDNDGVLDIYVAAYAAEIADLAASALGLPVTTELAKLYRGTGKGGFEDVSGRFNLKRPNAPMGSNFGDLDNDGYLDFYLGTGYPRIQNLMPNVMYRNRRGRGFADVSTSGGFAHLQKGHGVVFADFDHDGDQDIFEEMGGAFPGDKAHNVFYENPGFGNHWLTLKLVGVTRSNRSAIGARIRAEIVEDGVRRSVYKHVNSGGTFGANPLRQTIGLGKASPCEVLEVFWPTTGETQTWTNVRADQAIQIVEGEASYLAARAEADHARTRRGRDHAHSIVEGGSLDPPDATAGTNCPRIRRFAAQACGRCRVAGAIGVGDRALHPRRRFPTSSQLRQGERDSLAVDGRALHFIHVSRQHQRPFSIAQRSIG